VVVIEEKSFCDPVRIWDAENGVQTKFDMSIGLKAHPMFKGAG
jgi:hypothetical protein